MPAQFIFALLITVPALAYGGIQSAFDAKGRDAAQILEITWVLFIGGGLIFLVVMVLGLIALFGPPAMRASLGRHAWIIGGGIAFPVVVLSALLIYTFLAASSMVQAQDPPAARIEVAGELWWWRVKYLDENGKTILETANEIHIPAGRPVNLKLVSNNVIHSFWVPNLAGKMDLVPGHVNELVIQADQPGVFRGQCAEFCGAQHARMAFFVIAQTQEELDAWMAQQREPAAEPADAISRRGLAALRTNRCLECHAVRGVDEQISATGKGPDLTHVAGRSHLAGGTLENNRDNLTRIIADSQAVKPGNRMPSYPDLSAEDLEALVTYLEGLR